jgi:hypothetical protein
MRPPAAGEVAGGRRLLRASAMASVTIMVRVDRRTHAALERVRESMLLGEAMGLAELSKDFRDRFSLDKVIVRLIAFRDRAAERSRRSKARRKVKDIGEADYQHLDPELDRGGGV